MSLQILAGDEGEFPRFPLGSTVTSTSMALCTYLEIRAPYPLLLTSAIS